METLIGDHGLALTGWDRSVGHLEPGPKYFASVEFPCVSKIKQHGQGFRATRRVKK